MTTLLETPSARRRRLETPPPRRLPEGLEAFLDQFVGRWRSRAGRVRDWFRQVDAVEAKMAEWSALSERQLKLRLAEIRETWPLGGGRIEESRLHAGLAAVALAAERILEQRPYREQLMGVLALNEGCLVEMATGEGKTLTLALAGVLAAWRGRPCHILTANDYLAERDALKMGPLYTFCGVSCQGIIAGLDSETRQARYGAGVVYTTCRELVADYLRDRLRLERSPVTPRTLLTKTPRPTAGPTVLRGLHTVLVDEADYLLIDEAATPLVISQPQRDPVLEATCREAYGWVKNLNAGDDYAVDYKQREVRLSPTGIARIETLATQVRSPLLAAERWRREWVGLALKARELFHRDQHYAVDEGRVVIIDEGTGRFMAQRSWGQGLHQMIEVKENLMVTAPAVNIASVSFQRFFRQVPFLAGMTGTARENARELWRIYRLPVVTAPTHRPCRRTVAALQVFASDDARWEAVADEIARLHAAGHPVLAGTRSVAASERLSEALRRRQLAHQLLNAVEHRHEAKVIAQAGLPGTITVATNMAGRGTDIHLPLEVVATGGLTVVATERHESRRIDRQLYGRCARQGEPGKVVCFTSWEDELARRFLPAWMRRMGAWLASRKIPGAMVLQRWAFAAMQVGATRRAARMRLQVLRHDRWLDQSFG